MRWVALGFDTPFDPESLIEPKRLAGHAREGPAEPQASFGVVDRSIKPRDPLRKATPPSRHRYFACGQKRGADR
jgi:hypothetical protein